MIPHEQHASNKKQLIIRLPKSLAENVVVALSHKHGTPSNSGDLDTASLAIYPDRKAILQFKQEKYEGSLMQLPCILEIHENQDASNNLFHKKMDISQIIVFGKSNANGEFEYPHGLSKASQNIQRNRYQRISDPKPSQIEFALDCARKMRKGYTEKQYEIVHIEKQVQQEVTPKKMDKSTEDNKFSKKFVSPRQNFSQTSSVALDAFPCNEQMENKHDTRSEDARFEAQQQGSPPSSIEIQIGTSAESLSLEKTGYQAHAEASLEVQMHFSTSSSSQVPSLSASSSTIVGTDQLLFPSVHGKEKEVLISITRPSSTISNPLSSLIEHPDPEKERLNNQLHQLLKEIENHQANMKSGNAIVRKKATKLLEEAQKTKENIQTQLSKKTSEVGSR